MKIFHLMLLVATLLCSGCTSTVTWVRVTSDHFDPTAVVSALQKKSCGKGTTSGSVEMTASEDRGGRDRPRYVASAETVCQR